MASEHPLHQRRLGAGEDVADRALILHRRAQRVLDAAAVEGGDGLELVERDRHALLARRGNAAGQREDFGGEPRGVARGADAGKGQREAARRRRRCGVEAQLGPDAPAAVAGPAPQPAGRRVRGDQRPRVGLEEADVRARRGDGDFDREDALPAEAAHDVADERRLAVAARRNQEDLLAGRQVAREPLALVVAVGKRRRGDNLAVDERVARLPLR